MELFEAHLIKEYLKEINNFDEIILTKVIDHKLFYLVCFKLPESEMDVPNLSVVPKVKLNTWLDSHEPRETE